MNNPVQGIDWDGAPEGATHYHLSGYWYKIANKKEAYYWSPQFCRWEESMSWMCGEITSLTLIARPVEQNIIHNVKDLEESKEYFMCLGVNDERRIIFWGHNHHVAFLQDLANGAYHCVYLEEIFHFRPIPVEPTYEEKISEKYNIPLDTVKQMVENGLIKTTDND